MRFKILSLFLVLSVFVLVGAGCASQPSSEFIEPQGIILFEGDGCPHCALVEEFLAQNKVKEKVDFTTLEVYKNKDNAALLVKKAKICNIPTTGMGVPFLWDGTTCLVGDVEINKFFQEKIK